MKLLLLMLTAPLLFRPVAAFAQPAPPSQQGHSELVDGNNAFAVDLYGQLRRQPGNLFFSPASISTAFGMTYAGARGATAEQMARALHFDLPADRLHPAMGALIGALNAQHAGYQLRMADALWGQQGETFLPAFLDLVKTDYAGGFRAVDFARAPDQTRQTINRWIEQQTEDKIKDLLPPGVITSGTRLVLTNAIYFKANWNNQFKKADTKEEDFHAGTGQPVRAPLMHREGRYRYFNGGTFQALELPYAGAELSMIVLLPDDPGGLPALEQSMSPSVLKQWLSRLAFVPKVILSLPRFKMTDGFELGKTLGAMGMKLAFERGAADFSGMDGKRDLYISAAIHKAYVAVDEEGTEAAAATGTTMMALAAPVRREPIVFRADHPFVFLIRDNRSGAILFMGRITDPTRVE